MAKVHFHPTPSPDAVSFLDDEEQMMRLPHSHDVELLLSDRMVDEIGRALEDYPFAHPMSVCPSPAPRPESPGWNYAPQLISSTSSSTLGDVYGQLPIESSEMKYNPRKRQMNIVDGTASAVSTDSDSTGDQGSTTASDVQRNRAESTSTVNEELYYPQPSKKKKVKISEIDRPLNERSRKSSSTYRGVSLCTKDSRWQARIRIKKEVVYLGRFETEEAAAQRYDQAAREHHGDKALINFITTEDRELGRKSVFEQAGGKSARV